ncbi:MAG: exopolyphosphatase [Lactobacillus sp.]|nr:MAG: exopolyphosphatase [Lactobacillus sp.]
MAQSVLQAIIVINAQSIDLRIVDLKSLQTIEQASAPVVLGDHLFTSGGIDPQMVDEAIIKLRDFQQLIHDDGVEQTQVVVSHAVSQAENISFVQDQIYVQTGLTMTPLTVNEELMYRFQASAVLLPHFKKMASKGTILIQIGASVITMMVCEEERVTLVRELPLGPLRVAQILAGMERQVASYEEVLDDYLSSKLMDIWRMMPTHHFDRVILMGSKLTLLEEMIPTHKRDTSITHDQFDQRFSEVMKQSDQDLAEHLPQMEVAEVAPTFLLLDQIFDHLHVKEICLTDIKLIDGLMVHLSDQKGHLKTNWDFNQVVIDEAKCIAQRYRVDQQHQQQVLKFAGQLFDRLKKLHGLGKEERLLLQLAAILQDTGVFLDAHRHSFHSEYIILASEILGLNRAEQTVVAAVARYHSATAPSLDLSQMHQVSAADRLRIAKLSAILRLADALDDSHQAKISKISLHLDTDQVVITAQSTRAITLEQWTFQHKANFFRKVYGLKAVLKSNRLKG